MTQMFNPPLPGKELREYLGELDVTNAAKRLHLSHPKIEPQAPCIQRLRLVSP
jgi:plasmid maintenance system antidote protein VapI